LTANVELVDAYELWSSFKNEVLYKNRFLINHEVLSYLKKLADANIKIIQPQTILYRARQFDGDLESMRYFEKKITKDNKETSEPISALTLALLKARSNTKRDPDSGFWGYNKEESFVPSNNDLVNDGRVNPSLIKYLYTAEDAYTAMVEVRPYLESVVSIAEITVKSPLTIVDFSYDSLGELKGTEEFLMYLIMQDFSKPANLDKKSYIPTQYVAEFIKTLGMDGIRFNSSLHGRGRNLTIFNYEKCEPVSSSLYELSDICFEARNISPRGKPDLLHLKLQKARQKQLDEFHKHYWKRHSK
jgi:RES domain-containing protein